MGTPAADDIRIVYVFKRKESLSSICFRFDLIADCFLRTKRIDELTVKKMSKKLPEINNSCSNEKPLGLGLKSAPK